MNFFIDLGSHYGYTIRKFIASRPYTPDFVIHAFECNPVITNTVFSQYPKGVIVHKQAAWTYDGEISLYLNPNPTNQGASIYQEKTTNHLDKDHPRKIPCIDFSEWVKNNVHVGDKVIIKSNIEGSEYPVFDKMISDGTLVLIHSLYLNRHWNKIGMTKEQDEAFLSRLHSVKSLNLFCYPYKFE